VVKLDRLFVSSMTASRRQYELVKAIVGMAQTLNLNVVAEGIETEAERDLAVSAGCTEGQGFLFARPLPVDRVPDWLARERDVSQGWPG
jgi:EAL domain-containing protein (putative c-di-GMP-specific phosphodiesterase class I)